MNWLKHWIGKWAPASIVLQFKKWYYPSVLRRFDERKWPGFAVVKTLVSPGDTVVDAGANIGYVSMLLAGCVGKSGTVCSFEPVPETFSILQSNMRKLGLDQVRSFPCAVSSRDGTAMMEVPHYESGHENLYEARLAESGHQGESMRCVTVELRRVDGVLVDQHPPTFMKLDVEGHEYEAVIGAMDTIRSCKPSLMIEVTGEPDVEGSASFKLFELLSREGYQACWLDGSCLHRRRKGDTHIDYFFLAPQHVARLSQAGVAVV